MIGIKMLCMLSMDTCVTIRHLSRITYATSCSNCSTTRQVQQHTRCNSISQPTSSSTSLPCLSPSKMMCKTLPSTTTTSHFHTTPHRMQALVKRSSELIQPESTLFVRLKDRLGFFRQLRFNRFKMRIAGLNMYTSCVDGVDFKTFFRACNMSDTLFSWFLVTQLHVWMCMVRLRHEGIEGKYLMHYLILSMWTDVAQRGRVMEIPNSKMQHALSKMVEQFHGVLLAYDEGVMSSDQVLAAALWRNLFLQKCHDPELLANMVEYTRTQVQYLETLNSKQLLQVGRIRWLPFKGQISHMPEELPKASSVEEELLGPDPDLIDKVPT